MDGHEGGSATPVAGPRGFRRKSVNLSEQALVRATSEPGQTLPLVMEPASSGVDLADWAQVNRALINGHLHEHGAILFRGFELASVAEFERVAAAVYTELYGGYGDLPRVGASDKIYKSTPYPSDKPILFHNESSHLRI